jgi:hypothetical protein
MSEASELMIEYESALASIDDTCVTFTSDEALFQQIEKVIKAAAAVSRVIRGVRGGVGVTASASPEDDLQDMWRDAHQALEAMQAESKSLELEVQDVKTALRDVRARQKQVDAKYAVDCGALVRELEHCYARQAELVVRQDDLRSRTAFVEELVSDLEYANSANNANSATPATSSGTSSGTSATDLAIEFGTDFVPGGPVEQELMCLAIDQAAILQENAAEVELTVADAYATFRAAVGTEPFPLTETTAHALRRLLSTTVPADVWVPDSMNQWVPDFLQAIELCRPDATVYNPFVCTGVVVAWQRRYLRELLEGFMAGMMQALDEHIESLGGSERAHDLSCQHMGAVRLVVEALEPVRSVIDKRGTVFSSSFELVLPDDAMSNDEMAVAIEVLVRACRRHGSATPSVLPCFIRCTGFSEYVVPWLARDR